MNDLLMFAVASAVLALVFGTLEVLVRRGTVGSEGTRRVAHVAACGYAVWIHSFLSEGKFIAVAGSFVVLMAGSKLLHVLSSIHDTRRRTWGEVYMPLGLLLGAVIAGDNARAFVAAAVILGIADVAAGLVGDARGSESKTWGGTAVFAVVAIVVLVLLGRGVLRSVALGVGLALVERFSPWGTDNVTIPVAASAALEALEA